MIDVLIKKYFMYFDQKEEYFKIYKKSFSMLEEELISLFQDMSLKDLLRLYMKYTNSVYFQKHKGVGSCLDLVFQEMTNKISAESFLDLIELYKDVFASVLRAKENADSNQNIINIHSSNLDNESFIESQLKQKKVSLEKFLESYTNELLYYETLQLSYEKVLGYLDRLERFIFEVIDDIIQNSTFDDLFQYITILNERIERNSKEMIRRNELKRMPMYAYLESKFKEISETESLYRLDTTKLEIDNYICQSINSSLMERYQHNHNK